MSDPVVIPPERIMTQEGRFGIRSAKVNTSGGDVNAFLNALAARGYMPGQATQQAGQPLPAFSGQ